MSDRAAEVLVGCMYPGTTRTVCGGGGRVGGGLREKLGDYQMHEEKGRVGGTRGKVLTH